MLILLREVQGTARHGGGVVAKLETLDAHPEMIFVLSGPPQSRYAGDKVIVHYHATLRDACWGVVNGEGNGAVWSHSTGRTFGRLSLLRDGYTVELTHLVSSAFTDTVLALEAAGFARGLDYETRGVDARGHALKDWRIDSYTDDAAKKKLYSAIRKRAVDELVRQVTQELELHL